MPILPKFRTSLPRLAAAAVAIASGSAFAASAATTPAQDNPGLAASYTLQSFDADGKTSYTPITQTSQNPYFFSNCFDAAHCYKKVPAGAVVFKVPSGYGTTPNSHYPRSELRGKTEFKAGQTFEYTQSGTAYIIENPQTKSIIFAQIHGDKVGGSELFKLRWNDGTVVAGIKTNFGDKEKFDTLFKGVKLNEPIAYTLTASGDKTGIKVTLKISAHGQSVDRTYAFPRKSWEGIALYFKAGNYNQDSTRGGADAVVAYGGLKAS
ncbi:hypothetical protein K32_18080 [Kaistia sp. 32K]|uniref:polysaccharide lyase family 7 protein n=1 Tax=Kaistia sp. 32K TaxID=2795690 RepID=UPI001914DEDB|nr:polysaccharide lyase family 7 protein [Kaistia sp. 32K]BCP53191.1 hypothetical protein K32_18080 [Kaistia sp. 32K]